MSNVHSPCKAGLRKATRQDHPKLPDTGSLFRGDAPPTGDLGHVESNPIFVASLT
jgi:hypothetical protein